MAEQQSGLCCECTSRFNFSKSTLPAKIIQLRKISQENHVKRMKLAYQKKETQGLTSSSSCFSTSFQKKSVNNSKSSYSQPTSAHSYTDNKSIRRHKCDLLPAKAKSDSYSNTKYSASSESNKGKAKCIEVKKNQTISPCNNKSAPPSVFSSEADCHNKFNENVSLIENSNFSAAKLQAESKRYTSKDKKVSSSETKDENYRNEDAFLLKKSPTIVNGRKDVGDGKDNKKLVATRKLSKIPVLKSRFKEKDNTKRNDYNKLKTTNEIAKESIKSILQDVENHIKELNLQEAKEERENDAHVQEPFTPPSLGCDCYEEDLYKNMYHNICQEEDSHNEISLIDNWMNSILDDVENEKNSSESLMLKLKKITKTPPSQENNSSCTLRKECTIESLHINEDFEIPTKYDYITDITDTEDNSEIHYETEETDDGKSERNIGDSSRWGSANFEADSTITVPSDKDLELAEHRDPVYRSLPDYPNTPYNLRYPRFRFKQFNNIISAMETESADSANRAKVLKSRKKSYNTTPKRVKSGKKKKIKKQILRQREA